MALKLTNEEREKILQMHLEGFGIEEICKNTGRSKTTVNRVIKNSVAKDSHENEQSQGNERNPPSGLEDQLSEGKKLDDSSGKSNPMASETLEKYKERLKKMAESESTNVPTSSGEASETKVSEGTDEIRTTKEDTRIDDKEKNRKIVTEIKAPQMKLTEDILRSIGSNNANDVLGILRSLSSQGFDLKRFKRLSEALDDLNDRNWTLRGFIDLYDLFLELERRGFSLNVLNQLSSILGIEKTGFKNLFGEFMGYLKEKENLEKMIQNRKNELNEIEKLKERLTNEISAMKGKKNALSVEIGNLNSEASAVRSEKEGFRDRVGELSRQAGEITKKIEDDTLKFQEYVMKISEKLEKYKVMSAKMVESSDIFSRKDRNDLKIKASLAETDGRERIIDIGFSIYEAARLSSLFRNFL